MEDYITVLLDHLSEHTRPVYGSETLQENAAFAALDATFSPEQRKLFLKYDAARNESAAVREDAFARAAFLLARDIFR